MPQPAHLAAVMGAFSMTLAPRADGRRQSPWCGNTSPRWALGQEAVGHRQAQVKLRQDQESVPQALV